mmetsp:Transcript_97492/g.210250  ORF Transcript_97492/g.210250 Transcript_97492/m.210250 type:complete len:98 (-) Transcript_97492:7-300(-)
MLKVSFDDRVEKNRVQRTRHSTNATRTLVGKARHPQKDCMGAASAAILLSPLRGAGERRQPQAAAQQWGYVAARCLPWRGGGRYGGSAPGPPGREPA